MGVFDNFGKTAALDVTAEAYGAAEDNSDSSYAALPNYIVAADVHNILGSEGQFSFTDPSTWYTGMENAAMFGVAAITSGAASIYNSGVAAGNVFGLGAEEVRTEDWLAAADSDLSDYYLQNKQAADIVGFIAGSFIPGGAAIKAIQAAKAGKMGSNMAKVTGLLVPETQGLIAKAGADLANRQASFRAFDRDIVKAFAQGVQGAVVESIVAEAVVTATMFRSPVLTDLDASDIAANIFWGGVIGGTVGGALSAARIYGGVKKVVTKADAGAGSIKEITLQTSLPKTATEADLAIVRVKDAERFAAATVSDEVLTATTIENTRRKSINDLQLENRLGFQKLAAGDVALANTFADSMQGLSGQHHFENLLGLEELGRAGSKLRGETDAVKAANQATVAEVAGLAVTAPTKQVGYLRLHGDGAGQLSWDAPAITRLADSVATDKELAQAVARFGFKPADALRVDKPLQADAHYLWAAANVAYRKDMVLDKGAIPALMAVEKKLAAHPAEEAVAVVLRDAKGRKEVVTGLEQLHQVRMQQQEQLAQQLLAKGRSVEEVSTITNLKESFLLGQRGKVAALDYDARLAANTSYTDMLRAKGLHTGDELVDIGSRPQYAKAVYDFAARELPSSFEVDAISFYASKWNAYEQGVQRAIAAIAGDFNLDRFAKMSTDDVMGTTRFDSSAGLLGAANAGIDTLGSKGQLSGAGVADLTANMRKSTDDMLAPATSKLLADSEAAIEFSTVDNIMARSSEQYVFDEATGAFTPAAYKKWLDGGSTGEAPTFPKDTQLEIRVSRPAALEALLATTARNRNRGNHWKTLNAAQSIPNDKNLDAYYPIRKDPREFKHFVFVIDPTLTGTGHVSMIHAPDADVLAKMIARVPAGLKVVTNDGSKLYHKALGDYDFERTLHDNNIDSALKRAGAWGDHAIDTDPQVIVNKILQQHYRADTTLAREVARAANEKAFTSLEQLGKQYTEIAASKLGGVSPAEIDNPYENYIKTALNISTISEHTLLSGFNTAMDNAFSGVVGALRSAYSKVQKPEDLESLHGILQEHGVSGAYQDAAMTAYANVTPNRGELSKFVRGANSILGTLVLGSDPLSAVANAFGVNVLLTKEIGGLVKEIRAGNKELAGRLSQLAEVTIPGSEGVKQLATHKLYARMLKSWTSADRKDLVETYSALGLVSKDRRQLHNATEDLIITGAESAGQLQGKLSSSFDKFADIAFSASGNRLAQTFEQFAVVHMTKEITDLAETAGIYTRQDSLATINTMLNRVRGNMLASQRPMILQGPVGTALGLFQTYQFNLLQQMFRSISEGAPKDALMLLGMQGSIFGMNGLPAFNFLNTHIIGSASGNKQHTDLYTATYGAAGKELGDFLLYGVPSNLPKLLGGEGINLYTRGDINPRYLTILPNELAEVPAIRAVGAVWQTLAGSVQQIAAGAPVGEVLVQAMEHNSLSRPLAGLAQVAQAAGAGGQVYSTDNNSVLRGSNDLLHVSSLIRLAGGRPMDEALTTDFYYRTKVYAAKDAARMDVLRSAVRKSVIQGNVIEADEYGKFAEEYLKAGGKQKGFNKFIMKQYSTANTPAAQKLAAQLSSPYAQRMQDFLRGRTVTAEELAPPAPPADTSGAVAE